MWAISLGQPASKNVVDEMSEEDHQQQAPEAANPEEKMLGQLWGVDFLLVHFLAVREFNHKGSILSNVG
jgi:hypothetical protein